MKNLDKRIRTLLESRGVKTEKEIEEFFNPSISLLQPLNDFPEFKKATERIRQAIEQNEKIIIYGDYDTDGVSASAILCKYLKSQGAEPVVIIPNRFNDGYGLNINSLEQIVEQHLPDLFITVDCGITSVSEVAFLNEIGIDTIITDHHLPQKDFPQAVAIIDAKIEQHNYSFCDYCGAGIVLKLVQALGANVMDYIDIAALATIADIVPLIGENRAIAAVGLSKINSPSCCEGIKAIKRLINTENLSSQDVSFKIVPRINSTGRMKDAYLSFKLLVAEDKQEAEEIASQIEQINSERVSLIASSMEKIKQILFQTDLTNQNFVLARSKDFHEGILGILASKLVSDYQMPGFVFCEQDNGILKGSCRSPESVDIHNVLLSMSNLFETFGGHSQAAGITIKKENFQQFLAQLNEALKLQPKQDKKSKFDFEIEESDINLDFASQIQQLEPTGCGNPKPILKLKVGGCEFKKTSNPKHFQLITKGKKYFICFNGKQYQNAVLSGNAEIYFTLGTEIYNNNYRPKTSLISIGTNSIVPIGEDKDLALVSDAFGSIRSTNKIVLLKDEKSLLERAKELCKKSGTIVVARTTEELSAAKTSLGLNCYYCVPQNQESCIWYCPGAILQSENLSKYNSIVILSGSLTESTSQNAKVYSFKTTLDEIKNDKKIFADCYRVFASQKVASQNDICEYAAEISKYLPYTKAQIAFAVAVFAELGFIQTSDQNGNFCLSIVHKSQKSELSSSKLFSQIKSTTV